MILVFGEYLGTIEKKRLIFTQSKKSPSDYNLHSREPD